MWMVDLSQITVFLDNLLFKDSNTFLIKFEFKFPLSSTGVCTQIRTISKFFHSISS